MGSLRSPEVIERLYGVLSSMLRSVEGQLAAGAEDHAAFKARCMHQGSKGTTEYLRESEAYSKKRAGQIRFKVGVEQHLFEVRRLREKRRNSIFEDEANHRLMQRVVNLENAIRRHRDEFPAEDDPTDMDMSLWKLVADKGSPPRSRNWAEFGSRDVSGDAEERKDPHGSE